MTHSAVRTGCAVGVLCIASFVMVTSEFAPIGVLSLISTDLGRTPSDISLTVTLYAWIGAASGLLSHWLSRRVSRKVLLIVLMLAPAASNGLAALSGEFSILLGARILGALAHGVVWATVAATAAHLVSARRVGLATSVVTSGITIATVAGVPLINLVGQYDGWRTAIGMGVIVGSQALDSVGIRGTMMSASVVIIPAIVLMVTSQVSIRKKTAVT
ncbi:MFS transporter [Pseudomonas sp. CDFA 602]|uniref:MFS transporter n=1 Tax=Pseudomonas californiensis TaxID=2829823 RepID=UPI001E337F68|nr:MFS transporter [Pseudomonas californiensis]MCD5993512.1 MFS transporter [Pseudomonas californiensis]MCD5999107.1 MFS transporter [Pseudomonas californiensis]